MSIIDPRGEVLISVPRWLAKRLRYEADSLALPIGVMLYAMLDKTTEGKWRYIQRHRNSYLRKWGEKKVGGGE